MTYRCPVVPEHGRLLDIQRGDTLVWWCPHSDHSASAGRIFNERQARGEEPAPMTDDEADYLAKQEVHMFDKWARDILAGKTDRATAIAAIAKARRVSKDSVAGRLDLAVNAAKEAIKAEAAAAKSKPKRPAAAKAPGKQLLEHVEPAAFAALRDKLGLTNKECAAANEAAGLGSTLSRITELTASKGASTVIFTKVSAAWRSYAADLAKTGAAR